MFKKRNNEHIKIEYEDEPKKHKAVSVIYTWDSFRRPAAKITENTAEVVAMIVTPDYIVGTGVKDIDGVDEKQNVPVLRFFGVLYQQDQTKVPSLCLIKIHGLWPYFFVEPPSDMPLDNTIAAQAALLTFHVSLENAIKKKPYERGSAVIRVSLVSRYHGLGYQQGKKRLLIMIQLATPSYVPRARELLECKSIETFFWKQGSCAQVLQCYESNVPYVTRCLIDMGLSGASWFRINPHKYIITPPAKMTSKTQFEIDVHYTAIVPIPVDDPQVGMKIPTMRVMSFDIETALLDKKARGFPHPSFDPVALIAAVFHDHGTPLENARKVALVLNGCKEIKGVNAVSFGDEAVLLTAFADLINAAQPDIIIGYNICGYDFPYLMDRAEELGVHHYFAHISRLKNSSIFTQQSVFSSRARGNMEITNVVIPGVEIVDMLRFTQANYKLRSYTLNAVSQEMLDARKEDVHHSQITPLFKGTDEDRKRLTTYCVKDCELPLQLYKNWMITVDFLECARVKGTPISYIMSRGQQINTYAMLLKEARAASTVMPHIYEQVVQDLSAVDGNNSESDDDKEKTQQKKARARMLSPVAEARQKKRAQNVVSGKKVYKGATVLEPVKGFYEEPIVTLDYGSLYPSIMVAHNLCYVTYLFPDQIAKLGLVEGTDYERTPSGDCFVKKSIQEGLCTKLLERLLSTRKKIRIQIKSEKDVVAILTLDRRQNNIKLAANSTYGFTGTKTGGILCWLPISRSVTAFGRDYILLAKKIAESLLPQDLLKEGKAGVIYGDTDSIMVRGGFKNEEEAKKWADGACKKINDALPAPMSIVTDNIYPVFLLVSKKRYATVKYDPNKKEKVVATKGLETTRRDNCIFAIELLKDLMKAIFLERDTKAGVAKAAAEMAKLMRGEIDLYYLRISKSLQKRNMSKQDKREYEGARDQLLDDEAALLELKEEHNKYFYTSRQPHAVLADKLTARDPDQAVHLGDRLYYVIIEGAKKELMCNRVEDALYALENGLRIDVEYYKENQLRKPLTRLLKHIDPKAVDFIISGGNASITHMRLTPKPIHGKITMFVKTRTRCVACNASMPDQPTTEDNNTTYSLCNYCRETPELCHESYLESVAALNKYQHEFHSRWAGCQRCQKSSIQPVICGNTDCNNYFARVAASLKMDMYSKKVNAFSF